MTSLANTLTSKHLMAAFAVSHMCLHHWRNGTPTKDPLPTVETEGRAVLFKPQAVKSWAKKNGVEIADAKFLDPATEIKVERGPKKAAKKPAPKANKKLAKVIARSKKPLPRPGEAGYVAPKRKPREALAATA